MMGYERRRLVGGAVGGGGVAYLVGGYWSLIMLASGTMPANVVIGIRLIAAFGTLLGCAAGGWGGWLMRRNAHVRVWTVPTAFVVGVVVGVVATTVSGFALAMASMGLTDASFAVYGCYVVGWFAAAFAVMLAVFLCTRPPSASRFPGPRPPDGTGWS